MAEERLPALSAGVRMQPVHPDDVRIGEGRDPVARATRRKVSQPYRLAIPFIRLPLVPAAGRLMNPVRRRCVATEAT